MLRGVWGRKIGMTQVFSDQNRVVPVTVIDLGHWFITNIKIQNRDGYNAVQIGLVRKRYRDKPLNQEWLKKPKHYFIVLREIALVEQPEEPFQIGQSLDIETILSAGQEVNVFGITKGRGFQGVVKRHGYSGGPASHGPRFGRWPGSVSFMHSQGRVIKGKKLPGHMGTECRVMKNLEVIRVEKDEKIAMVKGSVPGGTGSLVFMQKV